MLLISLTKTVLIDSFLHPECIRWKNPIVLPWFYIYNLYQNAAAVTNYHKLGGLKTTNTSSHSSECRSPKSVSMGQNQGVGRTALKLEALEERLFLPLPTSADNCCLMAASLQPLPPSSHQLLLCVCVYLCLYSRTLYCFA